ncbi:MAG: prephenate dehydratase [Campylobacteraceae bacterium]|nr:prephenate dehydratase [Campylobacteraceae bacterium]
MNLDKYRKQIDDIDDEVLKLLNKRMVAVKTIGDLKQTTGTAIYRPEREREILDRLKSLNDGYLNNDAIDAIFQEIFAVSRNIELPENIAYLGPKGSFTHQVAQSRFGAMGRYIGLNSIEAVFTVLENKEAKYGVVPIENNTEGAVGVTLDCLGKYSAKIIAEIYMDIHHSFSSMCENLKEIKKIYSHPQGYNQCRKFLEEHFLNEVEFVATKSTAEAAKLAKLDINSAAICSHIAAKLYKLPILFSKIEDNMANKTRFLILSDFKNAKSDKSKTSILAKTADKPGGLVEFLQTFQKNRVNLTKIESRPTKEKGFKTVFYLDFEGHIDDKSVQTIISENKNSHEIIWLGSYVNGE